MYDRYHLSEGSDALPQHRDEPAVLMRGKGTDDGDASSIVSI